MKRITAIFLCLLLLLPLCACTAEEPKTETETAEPAKKAPANKHAEIGYPTVKDPLTWEKIRAIPVANSSMSTDELRQICTDYFRLQLSFEWTPEKSFHYVITSHGNDVSISKGTVYGGCLYVTGGYSNLYRVMQNYDEKTGIMSFSRTGDTTAALMGNQCSHGAFWGWARVSNSFTFTLTDTITEANGAIPLGPYEATKTRKHDSTSQICRENGKEIMYQSYALLQPADGLVQSDSAGHVRMASSKAAVVYNADGTINGEESYVHYLDQTSSFTAKGGVRYQGGIDNKISFARLYASGYVPFTLKEFLGTDPVEDGKIDVLEGEIKEEMTTKEIAALRISANYVISDVTTTLIAEDGTVLYDKLMSSGALYCYDLKLNKVFFPASVKSACKGGNETLKVVCRLSTGEEITVYEGKALF